MYNADISILERGRKAVENFEPTPYAKVDKTLRKAGMETLKDLQRKTNKLFSDCLKENDK